MSYKSLKLTTDILKSFELHPDHPERCEDLLKVQFGNFSWAGYYDDKLIFVGGFNEEVPCWSFWGAYSVHFKPIHARFIRRGFDQKFAEAPCVRAHHLVNVTNDHGMKLARFMGGKLEGIMEKYYNGGDYAIFARVK